MVAVTKTKSILSFSVLSLFALGFLSTTWLPSALGQTNQGWQQKWDRVLSEAKKEGEVVVWGPPGPNARESLTKGFQKSYPDINIVFTGGSGSRSSPKLLRERRAKRFLVDIRIGGTTTMLATLRPAGALDPIRPALILPEVLDSTKWLKGKLDYSDTKGRYNLVFTSAVKIPVAINPKLVKPEKIRSFRDLLDPKWAGKIAMRDPTGPGPGLSTVTHWYAHKALGKEFIRDLFVKQKLILSRNDRQLLEWVTRGRYAIVISPSGLATKELESKGVHVELMGADQFKEGSYLTAAFGSVALINRAPHPNAAKLYINWLLSRKAQTVWAQASGYPSRRLDVPRDKVNPLSIPKEGRVYQENYKEKYVRMRGKVRALLREVVKK